MYVLLVITTIISTAGPMTGGSIVSGTSFHTESACETAKTIVLSRALVPSNLTAVCLKDNLTASTDAH